MNHYQMTQRKPVLIVLFLCSLQSLGILTSLKANYLLTSFSYCYYLYPVPQHFFCHNWKLSCLLCSPSQQPNTSLMSASLVYLTLRCANSSAASEQSGRGHSSVCLQAKAASKLPQDKSFNEQWLFDPAIKEFLINLFIWSFYYFFNKIFQVFVS